MNKDVVEFYNSRGYPPREIVKRGVSRFNLRPDEIEEAMQIVSENGDIPDKELVWKVWEVAGNLDRAGYESQVVGQYRALRDNKRLRYTISFYRGILFAGMIVGIVLLYKEFIL